MAEAAAPVRLRRSVLYMPASNARALDKARTLPADGLIIDLEDAVAPAAKAAARAQMAAALARGGYGRREVVVRVNGLDTPWGAEDLQAAAAARPDAVLLPKIGSAGELRAAIDRLDAAGGGDLPVWVMAETPGAIVAIGAIAAFAPRLAVIVLGTSDLAAALRLPAEASRIGLLGSLSACVLAARSRGLDILDGVFTDLRDPSGLRASCQQGRALGFDGKTLIHPDQIATANDVFGITDEQAAGAARIVSAWEAAAATGQGVTVVDGRLVERLHADDARRLLALHGEGRRRSDN
jgi:citrate lyase subunit beta/citryl-CoA lyase